MKRLTAIFFILVITLFAYADNYQKAIDLYNDGVDLHDSNPSKALQKYQESLKYDQSIGEVYLNIGLIYINDGNLDWTIFVYINNFSDSGK